MTAAAAIEVETRAKTVTNAFGFREVFQTVREGLAFGGGQAR
jgi:hypothetical protein